MSVKVVRNNIVERIDYRNGEKMFDVLFIHAKKYIPILEKQSIQLIGNDIVRNEFAIYLKHSDKLEKYLSVGKINTDPEYEDNISIKIDKLTGEFKVKEYFTYNKFSIDFDKEFFLCAKYIGSNNITVYYFDDGNEDTVRKSITKMSKTKTNAITFNENGEVLYTSKYTNT